VPLIRHDARHTAATRMLDSRTTASAVAKWLGHDPAMTLRIYGHVYDDALVRGQRAAERQAEHRYDHALTGVTRSVVIAASHRLKVGSLRASSLGVRVIPIVGVSMKLGSWTALPFTFFGDGSRSRSLV
jgi:hypothetical protein